MTRKIKTGVAGIVVLSFFGVGLHMLWSGRPADSLVLVGVVAVLLGAGHHLWGDAMSKGVDDAKAVADTADDDGGEGDGR